MTYDYETRSAFVVRHPFFENMRVLKCQVTTKLREIIGCKINENTTLLTS